MSDLFPDAPRQVSLDRMIECVGREVLMRKRVYPRRIEAQVMTQKQADEEIAVMEAVRHALQTRLLHAEAELDRIRAAMAGAAETYRRAYELGRPSDPWNFALILDAISKGREDD
jgi:Xaa-Pro aminopeptidase